MNVVDQGHTLTCTNHWQQDIHVSKTRAGCQPDPEVSLQSQQHNMQIKPEGISFLQHFLDQNHLVRLRNIIYIYGSMVLATPRL